MQKQTTTKQRQVNTHCNPSPWQAEAEDQKFKVILGSWSVWVQPGIHKTLPQKTKNENPQTTTHQAEKIMKVVGFQTEKFKGT